MKEMNGYDARRAILAGEQFPDGLTVTESLDLSGCTGLTSLPDGLTVNGAMDLRGCTGLTSLPDRLTVAGWLGLRGCTGLTSLPDRLTVNGAMDLSGCTGLENYPRTPAQDAALRRVAAAALQANALDMTSWHTCDTTHCIAGWAQHISDDPAMKGAHPSWAGYKILGAAAATRFHLSNARARAWLQDVLEGRA